MHQQEREQHIRDYLNGKETAEGKALFNEWADRLAGDQRFLDSLNPDQLDRFENEIWAAITHKIDFSRIAAQPPVMSSTPFLNQPVDEQPTRFVDLPAYFRYGLAASVALLLLTSYVIWRIVYPSGMSSQLAHSEVVYRQVCVPTGQRMVVTLPDGSRIRLNAESRLRYPATLAGPARHVFLTGEGFFEVTPNPDQPFIVTTGTLTTTVKGTSFNVSAYAGEPTAEVTVLTGKVAVNARKGTQSVQLLTPGQTVSYQVSSNTFTKKTVTDRRQAPAWLSGRLVFQRTPMRLIVRQLQRQFGVRIKLANKALATCTVVGEFSQMPLSDVLATLCQSIGATYQVNGKEVHIHGNGCP